MMAVARGPVACAVLLALGCARVPSPGAAAEPDPIDYRESAPLDLLYEVRSELQSGSVDPALANAVAAAREMEAVLPWPMGQAPVDALLAASPSVAAARSRLQELPEKRFFRGQEVPLREPAGKLLDALAAAEPAFLASQWPRHREAIAAQRRRLQALLSLRAAKCLADIREDLELAAPSRLPVFVVANGPAFGGKIPVAVTLEALDESAFTVLPVAGVEADQLAEMTLHELTHQLDVATPRGTGVLSALRGRLADKGIAPPRDRRFHDVPHTLMFVEAADVVRRELDPAHRDYGSVDDCYYCKVGQIAGVVRAAWPRFLRGERTKEQAISEIVAAFDAQPATAP